jgi:hypothetical protein
MWEKEKDMAEEFKAITTQEEFDARIKDRIERAEAKARRETEANIRKEFDGWLSPDKVKELTDKHVAEVASLNEAHKAEIDKYAGMSEKFTEQETEIKSLRINALKTRIASEKHLPTDAVEFLNGEDEDSITASAERLSKLSASSHPVSFTRSMETDATSSIDDAYRKMLKQITE